MGEYYCRAYPRRPFSSFASETPFCSDGQRFSVEVAYTNLCFLSARRRRLETSVNTTHHRFSNISKDEIMQETTIVSWLSSMGVPSDYHSSVVAKVLQCARGMANDRRHRKVLFMRVDLHIAQLSDDSEDSEVKYEDDEDDDDEDHGSVEQEGCRRCAICLEDFNVGVRMPCLHMFHKKCILDWWQVGNSCPLCRFKFPPQMG